MIAIRGQIKWVVFDFGGTLAHSRPSFEGFILKHVYAAGTITNLQSIGQAICHTNQEQWIANVRHNSDAEDREFWKRFYNRILYHLNISFVDRIHVIHEMLREHYSIDSFELFTDSKPALYQMKRTRNKLAIASNFDTSLRKRLRHLGILDYIDQVVISAEIGISKPDTKFYKQLLNILRSSAKDVIMVGNSIVDDAEPSRALGIDGILLDRTMSYLCYKRRIGGLRELSAVLD